MAISALIKARPAIPSFRKARPATKPSCIPSMGEHLETYPGLRVRRWKTGRPGRIVTRPYGPNWDQPSTHEQEMGYRRWQPPPPPPPLPPLIPPPPPMWNMFPPPPKGAESSPPRSSSGRIEHDIQKVFMFRVQSLRVEMRRRVRRQCLKAWVRVVEQAHVLRQSLEAWARVVEQAREEEEASRQAASDAAWCTYDFDPHSEWN